MQYQLRVLADGQSPQKYQVEAASMQEAIHQAENQGLTVLQTLGGAESTSFSFFNIFKSGISIKAPTFPLILFCQEFRVLFDAGLSVTDVVQTLIDKETNAANSQVLQQLLHAIKEGKTLSQAMALNTSAFPSLFVATIAAAETSGDLSEALLRFSHYLENVDMLKKKIVSASLYPAIVTSFALLVLLFLVVYIIPKFSNIYQTQVKAVSASTQFLLSVGNFSQQYGGFLALIFIALLVTIVFVMANSQNRQKAMALCWRLPYVGAQIRLYYLTRFYRTLSMLLKSGIPVVQSLTMVDNLLGAELKIHLLEARKLICEGQSFSAAMQQTGLVTPVASRLFHVGEQTGTLDTMMERAASFHEEQMVRWIDRFIKILEPSLMAMIGLLIGGIVLMMYMPIFELASGIE